MNKSLTRIDRWIIKLVERFPKLESFFDNAIVVWFISRLKRIPERDHFIIAWFIGFGTATTASAVTVALGNPTGPDFFSHAMNIGKIVLLNAILFPILTIVLGALFSFIYLPLPRLFLGGFIYTVATNVTILHVAQSGMSFSFIIGIGYTFVVAFITLFFIILFHKKVNRAVKIALLAMPLVFGTSYFIFMKLNSEQVAIPALAEYTGSTMDENPAEKGSYDYSLFTYGSGKDLHREWFGKHVDEITPSVDASHFITKWGKDRKKFWGFDSSQLPVNGRTWMPEGDGPFPIMLMVHGNHTMEYFSTSGYDYLGEQLASRGFIAISVDEDFINYSNHLGSPNDNYKLRAWMVLQHLTHLQEMNESPENAFYQKINFDKVALMGHSRGGQAVQMATDYESFFDDEDDLLDSMENVNIEGIVAIAPTDKQIDDRYAEIHNTSYLLMHGARDADVSDYRSDRQFYRATFDPDDDGFKSTVYMEGANHTQFNTDWGSQDLSLPRGIFLNQQQMLAPNDQQQVAKMYLSAFLESVFNNDSSYEKLFQNYRHAQHWLPNTTLVTKYRHASYEPIKTFDNHNAEAIDASGVTTSEVITPEHRRGPNRARDALQLEWSNDASYSVDVEPVSFEQSEQLSLTMANSNDNAENEHVPDIEVELETTDGISVQLPLDEFMPVPPVITVDYTHFGLLDDHFREGRYANSWEPVFQTFELPLEAFEQADTTFNRDKINKITMHLTSYDGKILLEEIGSY